MGYYPCAKCEDDDGKTRCSYCGAGYFCDPCYNVHMRKQPEHKHGSWKPKWMRGKSEKQKMPLGEKYFENDEHTKWFGYNIETLENGGKVGSIIETARFTELVEKARANAATRIVFPSVVSFVGDTGTGKSTIIRGLMASTRQQETDLNDLDAPAPGMDNAHQPTTGEVNLYHDPVSFHTERPIFYADSEGIGGSTPASVAHQKRWNHDPLYHRHYMESRTLDRMRVVRRLYPKFLYIFSDVVCMVTRNPQSAADTAEKLLRWSQVAVTGAINQNFLPTLIIILNALQDEEEEYIQTPNKAVDDFYEMLDPEVQKNTTFKKLARKVSGVPLAKVTMKDILDLFFSNIHVHYIPSEGAGRLGGAQYVQGQFDKLLKHISDDVKNVHEIRQQNGACLDSNQMSIVFRSAFMQLASGKGGAFNFSLCRQQISLPSSTKDFMGTFLDVSLNGRIEQNFHYAASVIASSLIWEVIKSDGPDIVGTADTILSEDISKLCRQAITEFLDTSLECDYREPRTGNACKNTKLGHAKGHQDKEGQILSSGKFQNNHISSEQFLQTISDKIKIQLQLVREKERVKRMSFVKDEHKRILQAAPDKTFWTATHDAHNRLKKTAQEVPCFACLFRKPEYVLGCEHALCGECVSLFDASEEAYPTESIIERCPFCPPCGDSQSSSIGQHRIAIMPKLAGARILSLDGGGVRGIVELETLRRLEQQIGLDLAIGNFFDLIVGTSAGGLIALAIGAKNWTTQKCINDWNNLCRSSFQQKMGTKATYFIGYVVRVLRRSIYDTEKMENAFQQAFGTEDALYGLRSRAEGGLWQTTTRVAVTTSVNDKLRLFANYSWGDDRIYMRSRTTTLWEAARATTAAPMYFLPFRSGLDGTYCHDGGLIENNPVQTALNEGKAIWGEDVSVDLILSIGSGTARKAAPGISNASVNTDWITTLLNSFFETMNGKKFWEEFWEGNHTHRERARRLNVEFSQKQEYELDDLDSIGTMQTEAKVFKFRPEERWLQFQREVRPREPQSALSEIASRLRASLFFFQPDSIAHTKSKDAAHIIGAIYCRVDPWTSSYARLTNMTVCFTKGDHRLSMQNHGIQHLGELDDSGDEHMTEGESATRDRKAQSKSTHDERLRKMMAGASAGKTRFRYPIAFNWAPTQSKQSAQSEQLVDIRVRFTDGSIAPISGFPTTLAVSSAFPCPSEASWNSHLLSVEALQDYDRKYNIR